MFGSFSAICTNPRIAALLDRTMPLTRSDEDDEEALNLLRAPRLFAGSRAQNAASAGLSLRCGCWNEAHNIAQSDNSREGSYWHAIVHRQEPDTGNAGYWLRGVGTHPIFADLNSDADAILSTYPNLPWKTGAAWDPHRFLAWCDEARANPGSEKEQVALKIQQAEWLRLFTWCASPKQPPDDSARPV